MLTLHVRFQQNQFHATPWSHQVNEGVVEWPPSPWRLLRTLVSVGLSRSGQAPAAVETVVNKLAGSAPDIWASPVTVAQSRHYLPVWPEKTVKVLDTFCVLSARDTMSHAAHVVYAWPALELDPADYATLSEIAALVTFVGRAESWATCWLDSGVAQPDLLHLTPETGRGHSGEGDVVGAPWPLTPPELEAWREAAAHDAASRQVKRERDRAAASAKSFKEDKAFAKALLRALDALPATPWEVLGADTAALQKAGWSLPPGAMTLRYRRPPQLLASPRPAGQIRVTERRPTTARLLIASRVRPQVQRSLPYAERLRRALLYWTDAADGRRGELPDALTGRCADHTLAIGHEHLHVLCEPEKGRPRIGAFLIHVPAGIPPAMERALRNPGLVLREAEESDLPLVLAHMGTTQELGGFRGDLGQSTLLAAARVWESVTPFVGTRHSKPGRLANLPPGLRVTQTEPGSGGPAPSANEARVVQGDPADDLLRLLALNLEGATPIALHRMQHVHPIAGRPIACSEFRTQRRHGGGTRGGAFPCAFRITFAEAVRGPIALGFGAHFSLGLFRAVPDAPPGEP